MESLSVEIQYLSSSGNLDNRHLPKNAKKKTEKVIKDEEEDEEDDEEEEEEEEYDDEDIEFLEEEDPEDEPELPVQPLQDQLQLEELKETYTDIEIVKLNPGKWYHIFFISYLVKKCLGVLKRVSSAC